MRKILIATTSEATNAALLNSLSQYEGYTCNTGIEALSILEEVQPDILILDLMLPAMDGLTVLRKSSFKPHIILARTNLITPVVLQTAAAVGVQDIILIPCTIRYIVKRLDDLIERAPSTDA